MARNSKKVYQVLYEYGPLAKPRMKKLLQKEGFEMAWIGAQNSHGKDRIAIIATADATYYGLTVDGKKQLSYPLSVT